jgi:hypothetical protein
MAMWDLPEQTHPIHGRRTRRQPEYEHHSREERPEEGFERVGKTITEGAVTVMGIGVMGALGANIIGALGKK